MKVLQFSLLIWTTILLLFGFGTGLALPAAEQSLEKRNIPSNPTFAQLEDAAANVIQMLKQVNGDAKVAIVGGMALWKYIPRGRKTDDVDFIHNIDNDPKKVKKELLKLNKTPFVMDGDFFFYKNSKGEHIRVDFTPERQSPYMPTAAKVIKTIPKGQVPYMSKTDLVVFKILSSGLRLTEDKRKRDIGDAQAMLETFGAIPLDDKQRSEIKKVLSSMVPHSTRPLDWWIKKLGLTTKEIQSSDAAEKQKAAKEAANEVIKAKAKAADAAKEAKKAKESAAKAAKADKTTRLRLEREAKTKANSAERWAKIVVQAEAKARDAAKAAAASQKNGRPAYL